MIRRLPEGFEALEPFVDQWVHGGFQDRFVTRYTSEMADISAFYDAAAPLADQGLSEIGRVGLETQSEEHVTLFRLLMALAHVAVAVERYRQPRPKSVNWPATLVVTKGSYPS